MLHNIHINVSLILKYEKYYFYYLKYKYYFLQYKIIFNFSKLTHLEYLYIKDRIKLKTFIMPQLVPFFFVNQVTFNFLLLVIIIYMFSKYILPRFVRLFKTRLHITTI